MTKNETSKVQYRIYKEAFINTESEIIEPVLINCFDEPFAAIEFLQTLIKDSLDDFAHEDYYVERHIFKENDQDWQYEETFGRKKVGPRTAKGILYTRQEWNNENN